MADSQELISYNVRYLRTRLGMTQEGLAFASGMTTACISRLERNPGNPTVDTLDHIAGGLQVKTVHLFEEALNSSEGRVKIGLQRCFANVLELPLEKQQELILLMDNYLNMSKLI